MPPTDTQPQHAKPSERVRELTREVAGLSRESRQANYETAAQMYAMGQRLERIERAHDWRQSALIACLLMLALSVGIIAACMVINTNRQAQALDELRAQRKASEAVVEIYREEAAR